MKSYEIYSNLTTIKDMPLIIRIDGRRFSKYTKELKLKKPFDDRLRDIFIEVAKDLIKEFNVKYVYTFSDEINIYTEEIPFNGRIEKIDSIFASFVTSSFMKHLFLNKDLFDVNIETIPLASFDSRIIMTGNHQRQYFKWRQDEAWRNCLNSYAQNVLNQTNSPQETSKILFKQKKSEIHELLFENGINIAHVPTWQKRGIMIYKQKNEKTSINPHTNKESISYKSEIVVDMELNLIR